MLAIAASCKAGQVPGEVVLVIAPPGSPAIEKAQEAGLEVAVVDPIPDGYGERLLQALKDKGVEFIALAGYTRLLPIEVLQAYPNRILNVHPALLPKFGGKGMYGMRVHEAVLAAGEQESGCTVHFVNERYDEGKIILQKRVPVMQGDEPMDLAIRVNQQELIAFSEALAMVIRGEA
jgi:phosphoribosylglycinamide formyltransferase-1